MCLLAGVLDVGVLDVGVARGEPTTVVVRPRRHRELGHGARQS
jgi:hypothetical protein